jgi:hypothetical protein
MPRGAATELVNRRSSARATRGDNRVFTPYTSIPAGYPAAVGECRPREGE